MMFYIKTFLNNTALAEKGERMRNIWKYKVPFDGEWHLINMPSGAEIIYVGNQEDSLVFWTIVNPNTERVSKRYFKIYGTGHPILEGSSKYIGTTYFDTPMMRPLVLHLFEK